MRLLVLIVACALHAPSGAAGAHAFRCAPNDRSAGGLPVANVWHLTDKANRIRIVSPVPPEDVPPSGGPDPFDPPEDFHSNGGGVSIAGAPLKYLYYDLAGNLVADGTYYYQYDAWNRLIQINYIGTAVFNSANGRMTSGAPGARVRQYVYDGLGRLIARLSPSIINPAVDDRYDYYYDGVRRIQEDFALGAGINSGGNCPSGGGGLGGQLEYLHLLEPTTADANSDGTPDWPDANSDGTPDTPSGTTHNITYQGLDENTNGTPDSQEVDANTNGTLDDDEFGDANTDGTPDYPDADSNGTPDFGLDVYGLPPAITERQYLWGPDYVDECIAQINSCGLLTYVVQDANYNVVALVAGNSYTDANGTQVASGQVLTQYTWSPYGELLKAEQFASMPDNRLGHQGLFVDRLDGSGLLLSLQPDTPDLYYNRNRTYHPGLGRFCRRTLSKPSFLSSLSSRLRAGHQQTP